LLNAPSEETLENKKTKWNQMMKYINIWKLNELDQILNIKF
jgi:hypothetical protein